MMVAKLFPAFLIAVWLAFGLYQIVSLRLHLPSARARQVLSMLNDDVNISLSEALYRPLAERLAKWIRLGKYRKRRLARQLSLAGVDMTPEYYVAGSVVMGLYLLVLAAALLLLSLSFGLLFVLLGVWVALMAVLMVRRMLRRVHKWTQAHHNTLEAELPKLASNVVQSLKTDTHPDIQHVLERYNQNVAGPAMKKELTTLIADMATGSREIALDRFAARLDSEHASALTHALASIDKGENMRAFLSDLDVQLLNWEVLQLREEAANRPAEFTPAYIALLFSMVVLLVVLFGTVIWNSLQVFFQM